MKTVSSYPRDCLSRWLKNVPANIVCDEVKEFPYLNKKVRVNETGKIKQREAIFDKILKQMGPENDKYYVECDQDIDTYSLGKDEKVIVIESSDEEVEQRRKWKKSQQLTWMRLIKSRKNKLKQKE